MMLRLYRGLVDIFIKQSLVQEQEFVNHVRSEVPGVVEEHTIGVRGFWNILLEATLILYIQMFVTIGIILTIALAVVFFPLHALCMVTLNILNHRAEPFHQEFNEPTVEKKDAA